MLCNLRKEYLLLSFSVCIFFFYSISSFASSGVLPNMVLGSSSAMAGAALGTLSGGEAAVINPAALGYYNGKEIIASRTNYFLDTSYNYFSFTYNTLQFYYKGFSGGTMDKLDSGGQVVGEFFAKASETGLKYGITAFKNINVGLSLGLMSMDIDNYNQIIPSSNLGIIYRNPVKRYSFGSTLEFNTDKPSLRLDVGYKLKNTSVCFSWDNFETSCYAIGVEYLLSSALALRFGMSSTEVTTGIGISNNQYDLALAYRVHKDFVSENGLIISLKYNYN